jgi:hypothetical protein
MPLYEGHIIIREAETQWRFVESDIESAKVRLQDEVDNLIDQCVKMGVIEVKE